MSGFRMSGLRVVTVILGSTYNTKMVSTVYSICQTIEKLKNFVFRICANFRRTNGRSFHQSFKINQLKLQTGTAKLHFQAIWALLHVCKIYNYNCSMTQFRPIKNITELHSPRDALYFQI